MTITRRQFLRRSGLAAGGLASYGLFGNPLVRRALADVDDRFLVILFLDGGNDGLNTVTPITNGSGSLRADYEAQRTSLRLSTGELLPIGTDASTGAQLGLHPGLQGLKNLYDQGNVAVIQGCGYPEYSLSHERARRIWETAAPLSSVGDGWAGRSLIEAGYGPLDIPGVTIDGTVAGELGQSGTSILAIRELESFGFPYDDEDDYVGDILAKRAAFLSLYSSAAASAAAKVQFLGNVGSSTLTASEDYPPAHTTYQADRGSWASQYESLGSGMANRFREVAKIMYGNQQGLPGIGARFFQLSNGGYDTHADQGAGQANGRHTELHREVADALELFYADVADMGLANDLMVMVWSEFSRRIQQNGNGTDHGSQGPVFVIGGQVNGGVYGHHPDISPSELNDDGNTPYSQTSGDPFRSTDFRDIYGTILKRGVGMNESLILSDILPPDPGSDDDNYWTSGNHDFDMGFLPPFVP
jgi:uncharacterized protein (DUF1501 family)